MGKIYGDAELAKGAEKLKAICQSEGISGTICVRGLPLDKLKLFVRIKSVHVDPLSEQRGWRFAERKAEQECDAGSRKTTLTKPTASVGRPSGRLFKAGSGDLRE